MYKLGVTVLTNRCCYSNAFEEKSVFVSLQTRKKEICIYHSNNSNKSQQDIANVLLQSLILKTCSSCVHDMTCIEYRYAHSVVSRYPANLVSRQKYTSDRVWRDNEVRLC